MKTTYTVTAVSINDGKKTEVGSNIGRKREAIKIAEAIKGAGIYCEVMKRAPFVVHHCIYQTGTGTEPANA